jgi:nucleoside-diphosphate-sugar epimerase
MTLRVVVTGAGGFVGRFVAERLAEQGLAVTAAARAVPEDAVAGSASGPRWLKADLLEPRMLPEAFDALIHCAALLPSRCAEPAALYRGNFEMASRVFDQAVRAGARIIVNLSSMSVYGAISVPVVTETLAPTDPDPYGRAKLDAERLLADLCGAHDLSGLSIRLPGTVGKGSHHNFLSDCLARIRNGETLKALNPEAAFNNIVHVRDLARFIADWLRAPRPGHAVTNLAAQEPLSIREVLALMFETASRPERIVYATGGKPPFLIGLDQAQALGYHPATVRDSVVAMVRDCLAP